jgi:hypothetical protein
MKDTETVRLIVKRTLRYRGAIYRTGSVFEAQQSESKEFIDKGYATRARQFSGQYRRRDLKAEE